MKNTLFALLLLSFTVSDNIHAAADENTASQSIPEVELAPPGGDFTLHSATGPVALKEFRGKAVFLYFGYTNCPDVCPTSLSYLTQALNELSEQELKRVNGIFISVDPQRETMQGLQEYAEYFHPNLIGVTGTAEEVAEAAKKYGAKYYEVALEGSAFGYSINHSVSTYLIAPDGTLRFIFPHGTPPMVLLKAVQYVLEGN